MSESLPGLLRVIAAQFDDSSGEHQTLMLAADKIERLHDKLTPEAVMSLVYDCLHPPMIADRGIKEIEQINATIRVITTGGSIWTLSVVEEG